MVKSYTRRKFVKKKATNKPPDQITQLTNAATDYIKQWTRRELGKIQDNQETNICIPVKNGYKIGLYNLRVNANKTCEVYDRNEDLVHVFENKISAVLYTIYTIKKKYYQADQLLALDTEINKNYTDMLSLRRGLERARLEKDFVSMDIRQNRLEIAEKQLALARDQISKIHKEAKYLKVWE
jgi:hypothetical protein